MEPDETARRVRYWRERRGLSRRACADLIGYSEGWLQKIEQGQRRLDRLPVLSELARVLRVPISELLPTPAKPAAASDPIDTDLLELSQVARARGVAAELLTGLEADLARLHQAYATLGPHDLLPVLVARLRPLTVLLQRPQPSRDRRRLLRAAADLAGLRGWLAFDMRDEGCSRLWYRSALRLAREAGDGSCAGWLLGGLSLLPSYSGRPGLALRLLEYGHRSAGRGADRALLGWLCALEARARAEGGDAGRAREALSRAYAAAGSTAESERRHGMDFRGDELDVSYYEGMTWLALRDARAAEPVLQHAHAVLTPDRAKARSILLLTLARVAVLAGDVDRACGLVHRALDLPRSQRIGPIATRAREVRQELEPWSTSRQVRQLDEVLAG